MKKRIAIFGISGSTGQAIVKNGLARDYEIIGLARPSSQLPEENKNVEIVRGELSDREKIIQVVNGSDAVICVLGPRPPFSDLFCGDATAAILQAMQGTGSNRLICVTGAMIGPAENRAFLLDWMANRFMQRAPEATADRHRQEDLIMSSGIDWTLVKPPRLTDSAAGGNVSAGSDLRVGLFSKLSRADLAEFCINILEQNQHVQERVFVTG